ncbi:RidA family protein [Nitriliruptor alkaliphilus]|uniref:RidA family protein n=1 Tax=Nitriliruptor alkaliphilus TaxID=427918 RepID=UPI000695DE7A|nr:RidA family protein [Nitriliruptor alkaliphilus]
MNPTTNPALTLSNPTGLYDPTANGYSHVAVVAAGAETIHVAGQGGEDEDGVLEPDFPGQVRKALDNVVVALRSVGAGPADVVRLTVLIVDHDEAKLHVLGGEFDRIFGDGLKPTCTLIPVPRLALDGMLFEVEATAVRPVRTR